MHTFSKIFWATEGRVKSIPIYTPFNQLNLQTDSYWENVYQKWNQTLRHSYGIHEVSYNIFKFSIAKVKTLRGFCYIYYFIDIMLIHNCFTIPLIFIHQIYSMIGSTSPSFVAHEGVLQFLAVGSCVLNVASLLTFEVFKRYSNKRFYKGKDESWLRVLQYGLFLTLGIFGFIYPTFLIASIVGFSKNI